MNFATLTFRSPFTARLHIIFSSTSLTHEGLVMSLIPHRFLFRFLYRCPYVKTIPTDDEENLIELPESCRFRSLSEIDDAPLFADVRLGWNEKGIGLWLEVKGKDQYPVGDPERLRQSDGITLWIDTRGDRSSHRGTRTCHQFHFLAAGGGSEKDEPLFAQSKIHRALQDAPLASGEDVPFRCERIKKGYRIEAWLSAQVLSGFDPEEHPKMGIFYSVRDFELGEQTPNADPNFPYSEDPSLWCVMELSR
jgi:hypothetical protein